MSLPVVELRIHGVGGPQAPKMLGFLHESDVSTLGSMPSPSGAQVPPDGDSRFVRPVVSDPANQTEAYEWGRLTTGSLWKSLWVVFLPFTVLNVAGWARTSSGLAKNGRRLRDLGARVIAHLATVTYVLWVGYLLFELVGLQWRRRLEMSSGIFGRLGDVLPALCVAFFLAVLGGMVYANVKSGRQFEGANPDRRTPPPKGWDDSETAIHKDFFAHQASADRLRVRHLFTGAVAGMGVLALAYRGVGEPRSRLGLAIVVVATLQVAVLSLAWVLALLRAPTGQGLSGLRRAGLLTLGTVLCHAAFAGAGLWLRDRLATVPRGDDTSPLSAGPELALSSQFALALVGVAVVGVLGALVPERRGTAEGMAVRAARHVPWLGVLVAAVFIVAFSGFSVAQVFGDTWRGCAKDVGGLDTMSCWYDQYKVGTSKALQDLGAKALVAVPFAFALSLRSSTAAARALGNVWDVFTFWPRRYHPFAVPPYAERAVPELRVRIRTLLGHGNGVVVCAHSQGSVLAVAAVGAVLQSGKNVRLHLITFGSPLGSLIAPVFPAALGRDVLDTVRCRLACAGRRWWVLWRKTDPIGGPVFGDGHLDEHRLDDPPGDTGWVVPADVASRPPLDRPPRWGTTRGHGSYTAEPLYRAAVESARTDLA